jgi:outer membrane murein-binding lipoprotein Lpp
MELNTMITPPARPQRTHRSAWTLAALALGSSLLLAGCAGNPPSEQLAVSKSAVNSAVSAGGPEFAAVEMKSAQEKLKQAEQQLHDHNYEEAKRLAEQAEWDARLAERKAQAAKAEKALEDARQGVEEMREESMRGSSL